MTPQKRNALIIGGIVLVVVLLLTGYFVSNKTDSKKDEVKEVKLPTEAVIPTIDSSVSVDLISQNKKEAILSIKGIPKGTKSIEYVLSYSTKEGGLEGINSTIEVEKNVDEYEKTITLGTCSSGVCRYHNVEGNIKVELKFSGGYGEKLFEKEFEI